jgi:hypothetical protein
MMTEYMSKLVRNNTARDERKINIILQSRGTVFVHHFLTKYYLHELPHFSFVATLCFFIASFGYISQGSVIKMLTKRHFSSRIQQDDL